MIFALIDYIKYRKGKGLYNLSNDPIMQYGFPGEIPIPTLKALEPGDVIFTFTSNSFISWAIMYLTKARMSHVSQYIGNNSIIHSTTEGVISESIESLFSKKSVFLPLHIQNVTRDDRNKLVKYLKDSIGVPYGWNVVLKKFLRIISGRDVPYFRFAHFVDLLLILLVSDLMLFLLFNKFIFIFLIIPYLFLLIMNRFLWRRIPIPLDKYYVKPIDLYKMLILRGADIYANPNGILSKEFINNILDEKLKID